MGIFNKVANILENGVKQIAKDKLKKLARAVPVAIAVILIMFVSIMGGALDDEEVQADDDTSGYTDFDGDSFELCKQWIRSFEGHEGISEDGTKYKIGLVGKNRTVGYGVDLDAGGYDSYFKGLGYNTSAGSYIPVEIVDQVEEEELQNAIKTAQSKTSELSLKEYQIHVLVSRAYNAGRGYDFGSDNSFVTAYKSYWDENRDGEYGKEPTDSIYQKDFFKNYMTKPNTSDGAFLQGLQNRREREWKLFVCGYYDFGGKGDNVFWSETSSSSGEGGIGGTENKQSGDGYSSTFTSGTRTYKNYKQGEGNWANVTYKYYGSSMALSGCSLTAIATVASGFDSKVTPLTVVNKSNSENTADLASLLSYFTGLKVIDHDGAGKTISTESAKQGIVKQLKNGYPVMVGCCGGDSHRTFLGNLSNK